MARSVGPQPFDRGDALQILTLDTALTIDPQIIGLIARDLNDNGSSTSEETLKWNDQYC